MMRISSLQLTKHIASDYQLFISSATRDICHNVLLVLDGSFGDFKNRFKYAWPLMEHIFIYFSQKQDPIS
jgi:hypothetical protein